MGQNKQQGSGTAGPTHQTRRKIPRACCTNVQWTRLREGRFDLSHHRKRSLVLCPGVNAAFGERENGHRGVGILQIPVICTENGTGRSGKLRPKMLSSYPHVREGYEKCLRKATERPTNGENGGRRHVFCRSRESGSRGVSEAFPLLLTKPIGRGVRPLAKQGWIRLPRGGRGRLVIVPLAPLREGFLKRWQL